MGQQERQLDVFQSGQHRDQVVSLEDETDIVGPPTSDLRLAQVAEVLSVHKYLAARGAIEPGDQVQEGRLARARRAHPGRETPPAFDSEVQTDQHGDTELVAPVFLVDCVEEDRWRFGHGRMILSLAVALAAVSR